VNAMTTATARCGLTALSRAFITRMDTVMLLGWREPPFWGDLMKYAQGRTGRPSWVLRSRRRATRGGRVPIARKPQVGRLRGPVVWPQCASWLPPARRPQADPIGVLWSSHSAPHGIWAGLLAQDRWQQGHAVVEYMHKHVVMHKQSRACKRIPWKQGE
jgi:hypothetical protein